MLEKICELLVRRGITQVAFERSVGLAKNRISKWKDDIGEPTARQIWEISRWLGVPVEYLLDDDQERPAQPPNEEEERILWLVRELGIEQAKAILFEHLRLTSRGSVAGPAAGSGGVQAAEGVHAVILPDRPRRKQEPGREDQVQPAHADPLARA